MNVQLKNRKIAQHATWGFFLRILAWIFCISSYTFTALLHPLLYKDNINIRLKLLWVLLYMCLNMLFKVLNRVCWIIEMPLFWLVSAESKGIVERLLLLRSNTSSNNFKGRLNWLIWRKEKSHNSRFNMSIDTHALVKYYILVEEENWVTFGTEL